MKIASLFANIGVAEAYLNEFSNVRVVVANEFIKRRADLYQKIYPETNMICGDITHEKIYQSVLQACRNTNVDTIMATPPCQGMSTAGQKIKFDERNSLVMYAIRLIHDLKPKYVLIENVPDFRITSILYHGVEVLLPEVIHKELDADYHIDIHVINTDDYKVPQTRERMIILMTRNDIEKIWTLPPTESPKVTVFDAIGKIPIIDPFVKDIPEQQFHKMFPLYEERKRQAISLSPWNIPPVHVFRQVRVMQYTPTGKTAFDNAPAHRPMKKDGMPVRGYHNTYKRQNWDTPAYTVTMDNRKISSQNNVHPGRPLGRDENGEIIYSDARTLTLYEIMKIMSLPDDWNIPIDTEESFLRRIIGEGIPPLFIKKLFRQIAR
ncbi:MAG: DNA cytosine methyltransferase [Bacteroidales bacterium]|nr:DNA cytosine methyltransferase [Bacteroidales bacterium]